ncbi:MAG: hypothetical protein J7501_02100 [Bdellovibrio sp.]|nr:hypothetical protein [Bdellovibrio sp.]
MEQFQSPRVWFPSPDSPILADAPGRYPVVFNFLFQSILGWTPTGAGKNLSEKCSTDLWESRMRDPRLAVSAQIQGGLVQKYLQQCSAELESGDDGGLTNARRMLSMSYDPQGHPFLRRVVINLPGNVKLKGLLALKGDFKRRPFVILRSGIFSSIEDFRPERGWLMMLFEQAPFNVLLVENMTSADFIANNNQFSFGGYDEGIQNILLAQMLKNPVEPLSRIVDSVHVFGMSLGGHGVLFSSLLNKYNSPNGHSLIQSFLAMCPVVNLKPTMESLTQSGVKSAFVDLWGRRRLGNLEEKLPGLVQYDSFKYLNKAVSEVVRTYHGGLSYISTVKLPPGMKDSESFWHDNDFWKFYQDVQEPVMIWATEQDPLVPFDKNSQMLLNKQMKVASKNLRVVEFAQGFHCTLPVAYDWKFISSMFQAYILSHSPTFKMRDQNLNMELSDEEWKGFFTGPILTQFEVDEPGRKKNFVKIEIKMVNPQGKDKSMNLSLPLSEFDFRFLNSVLSSSEKEMVVRWINQNLRVSVQQAAGKANLKVSWPIAL